jgi:putative SOS response-associated peptidase YedK
MCGRFVQIGPLTVYAGLLGIEEVPGDFAPRFNVAPSQAVLAVRERDGRRELCPLRWGLVPHWSKGPDPRFSMINAKAETVHEKPAYRGPFRHRRCLVPTEAFYEWQAGPTGKQPYAICLKSREPFMLAGLWDAWTSPDGSPLETCSVLVTDANAVLAPLHERMPVILSPAQWDRWLDPRVQDVQALRGMLVPYDADPMEAYPVSKRVNSPRNEGAELLEAVWESG